MKEPYYAEIFPRLFYLLFLKVAPWLICHSESFLSDDFLYSLSSTSVVFLFLLLFVLVYLYSLFYYPFAFFFILTSLRITCCLFCILAFVDISCYRIFVAWEGNVDLLDVTRNFILTHSSLSPKIKPSNDSLFKWQNFSRSKRLRRPRSLKHSGKR